MKHRIRLAFAALALALGLGGVPRAMAATVTVMTVLEGRTTDGSGHSALLLVGKGLKGVDHLHLEPPTGGDLSLPTVDLPLTTVAGSTLAIFEDSDGLLVPGEYQVTLVLKKGGTQQDAGLVSLAVGGLLPGASVGVDTFSAFADLQDESRIGPGSSQVAPGNHAHLGVYSPIAHTHDTDYPKKADLSAAGTINTVSNPVDWTKIKNVPAAFADGTDDGNSYTAGAGLSLNAGAFAVAYSGNGAAPTASRSDHSHDAAYSASNHNHDTLYFTQAVLTAVTGTLNASTNPVDWSQLKSVPAGFADGTDADTTYGAGTGISLASGNFSVVFAGTGSSTSAARSDHDHDTRYNTQAQLSAATGVLNALTNPLDWSQMKSVPTGFADGSDNDTTYTAGTGITLTTGSFAADFGGPGSAATVARSDHNHDAAYAAIVHNHDTRYYTQAQLNSSTGTVNGSTNPLDWSQLKSVPAGFADGVDDSVTFAGTGAAASAARSDHDHDARYFTEAELSSTGGTLNDAANPVEWNRLKGVPSGFADGADATVTLAGTGSASTGAHSDHNHNLDYTAIGHDHLGVYSAFNHNHDTRYYTQSALNDVSGTINATTNPVDWTQLKSVPSGLADGVDDGAAVTGSGTAATASRSDHNHDLSYLGLGGGSMTGTLAVANSTLNSVTVLAGAATGAGSGTQVGIGVEGSSAGFSGIGVNGYASGASTSYGVRGEATNSVGSNYGVFGKSQSVSGYGGYFTGPAAGAYGDATGGTGTTYGVRGSAASSSGFGGYFTNTGVGLRAVTTGGGVALEADHTGTSGNIAEFKSGGTTVASIDKTGTATFNGGIVGLPLSSTLSTAGTINTATNPVDWTKLKGVPAGFADGTDDSVTFAGTGSAATASRSDHNHASVYVSTAGDTMTGPLSISFGNNGTATISGVNTWPNGSGIGVYGKATPPGGYGGYFESTSGSGYGGYLTGPVTGGYGAATNTSGTTYGVKGSAASSSGYGGYFTNSGVGLLAVTTGSSVAYVADHQGSGGNIAEFKSAGTTVASIDKTGAATFNGGIVGMALSSTLSTAGTINSATNPVDWTKLKGVPAGFSDGVDDTTTLAGNGVATTASRSDHNHDATYLGLTGGTVTGRTVFTGYSSSPYGTLDVTDTNAYNPTAAIRGTSSVGYGVQGVGNYGVVGWTTGGTGVYGGDSGTSTTSYGVQGTTTSTAGKGVSGVASATTGTNYGVYGSSGSSSGAGVYGTSPGTGVYGIGNNYGVNGSGGTAGVYGTSGGNNSVGVKGDATGAGSTYGLHATAASTSGTGVYGEAQATSGTTYGVSGRVYSTSGYAGYFTGVAKGIYADATNTTGTTYGVYALNQSASGYGGYFEATKTSGTTYGAFVKSSSGSGFALYADNAATSGNAYGSYSRSASSGGVGAMGESTSSGTGVFAQSSTGNSLVTNIGNGTPSTSVNNAAIFQTNSTNVARIDNTGKGFFNGGTQASGADFAESVAVNAPKASFEPGDVIAVDPTGERRFALSREADSALVAGVYSTKPALLGTTHDVAGGGPAMADEVPLGVVGIVPTKVCDEGGAIRAGDLLVTASRPGHAKKASANPAPGTVLGKALGSLRGAEGRVEVLLMAR